MQGDRPPDPFQTINPWPSPSQANWHRVYKLAPGVRKLYLDAFANFPAPKPTARDDFVSLCACFCDHERREALRALIFDLIQDDMIELLAPPAPEEPI